MWYGHSQQYSARWDKSTALATYIFLTSFHSSSNCSIKLHNVSFTYISPSPSLPFLLPPPMALEVETLNSPSSAGPISRHEDTVDHRSWKKAKRTKQSRLDSDTPQTEEEYLALCLLMLAQGHRSSPPPISSTNGSYTCSVCHRSFPSYQALGGHKASHKNKSPMTEERQTARTVTGMTKRSGLRNPMSDSITRTHRCSVCLKTFASGQALGGHKRRHFEGGSGSSGLTLTEDADELGHASHLGFDLNLPASPEQSWEAKSVDLGRKSQLSGDPEAENMMIGPSKMKKINS